MRNTALILLFILVSPRLFSQSPWCGTHRNETPTPEETRLNEEFREYYRNRVNNLNASSKRAASYIIPVVFHVIHENGPENVSDASLMGLIEQVNLDFSRKSKDSNAIQAPFKSKAVDAQIEFRLAQLDPDGNCTNGITRSYSKLTNDVRDFGGNNVKGISRWPSNRYLNIWIVKSILSEEGFITLGYSYYPGISSNLDGIVLRYDQMSSNSLTHEIGHYLNLIHTFGESPENGDGCGSSCISTGDEVCDTPPTAEANFNCPKGRNSCSNDFPDQIDMIENYMDYASCSGMFTEGQKLRMHSAIDFYRSNLVSASNLASTGVDGNEVVVAPKADFYTFSTRICQGESLNFINASCNHSGNSSFQWSFNGPENLESTEQQPKITFNIPGVYDVTLTVTNSKGTDSKTISKYINVGSDISDLKSPYTQGFDQLTNMPWDWKLEDDGSGIAWKLNHSVGYLNSQCIYVSNFHNANDGATASFILPALDIFENDDKFLRYKVSYAGVDETSSDIFQISLSLDCGASWRLIQSEVSSRLRTTTDRSYSYLPSENAHWKEIEVDLTRYQNNRNIMIKFTFISGGGNNIFIDDLRIGSTEIGIAEQTSSIPINVFPNPATELLHIELPNYETLNEIRLVDLTGKVVVSKSGNFANTTLDISSLESGVYNLIGISKNRIVIRKIIIE